MAAMLSSHCCPSPHTEAASTAFQNPLASASAATPLGLPGLILVVSRRIILFISKSAISLALAIGLVTGVATLSLPARATPANPVLPDLSVLFSGPPIKDPGALLRNALPIDNKAIREVQKPLKDITDRLKVSRVRALDFS